MIKTNYTKTGDVYRMVDIEDTEQQELEMIFEDIPLHIQPLDDSYTQDIDNSYGKDFLIFTDNRDIQQGDRIVIDDLEYRIMGLERYEFKGKIKHMEIRARLFI